jgi:hypothetical protein
MTIRYHARGGKDLPTYLCQRDGIDNARPICAAIPGHTLDEQVGQLLIDTLTPLAVEAALQVSAELQQRAAEADALRAAHVERATTTPTWCFASDFVSQFPTEIPSHQTACQTSLEADHLVGSDRELAQASPSPGAQREVRDLRVGAHRAGHPAGSRGEVEGGPVNGGAHLPDREAGRPGCAVGLGPGRPGMTAEQAALAEARAELERLRATVTEQAVALHLHAGKAGWD